MLRKSAAPAPNPDGIHFVLVNTPNDGSWRRVVRSHTARRHYAEARKRYGDRVKTAGADNNGSWQIPAGSAHQSRPSPLTDPAPTGLCPDYHVDAYRSNRSGQATLDPWMPLQIRSIDPFNSLSRPTTRFEKHLLEHYMQCVVFHTGLCAGPAARKYVKPRSGLHCVKLAVSDKGLLNAILLSACRSLAAQQASTMYADYALQYKGACLRSVNDAISERGRQLSFGTLATVLALAHDAFIAQDFVVARQHCKAAEMMVQMKGGPRAIPGEQFFRIMVQWVTPDSQVPDEIDPRNEVWKVLEGYLEEMWPLI